MLSLTSHTFVTGLLTDAESDITQALTIYDRVLRPIADNPSLITHIAASSDTTSVDASSSSSSSPSSPTSSSSSLDYHVTALASYLGGINLHDVSDGVDQHVDVHLQRQLRIGLYVQGELHFRMGRYETSLSSLKQAANTGTWMISNATTNEEFRGQWEGKELEYLNNAACIHMNQKRYHAAGLFMQKAMVRLSQPLSTIDHENTHVYQPTLSYVNAMGVIYNAGLTCLYADNPYGAFQCFEKTIPELHARPILWLRMAECCIRHHTSSPSSSSSKTIASLKDTPKVLVHKEHSLHGKNGTITDSLLSPVSGLEGRGRRFVINLPEDEVEEAGGVSSIGSGSSRDKDTTADGHAATTNDTNASSVMATTTTASEKHGCSIARASQYLNNALFLMRTVRATNKTSSISEGGSPLLNGDSHAVVNNNYPTGGSVGMDTLEATALLQLSYVYLLQHNPVAALSASNEILAQSKLAEAGGQDTRYTHISRRPTYPTYLLFIMYTLEYTSSLLYLHLMLPK